MIRLHHCSQSRSMRSLWLLHELGIEFTVQTHPFGKNLRSPEFLALHPVGRVPALEIDGRVIWETGAITEYLCDRFPEAGLGRAPGDEERADWLIWVHFSETLTQHAAHLTQQHVVLYEDSMRSDIIMSLEPRRIGKCYGALDDRLSGRDFLLDGGFSAADISVGQAVYMARHFTRIEPFEHLARWYQMLEERPGFQKSLPGPNEVLYTRSFYEPAQG